MAERRELARDREDVASSAVGSVEDNLGHEEDADSVSPAVPVRPVVAASSS